MKLLVFRALWGMTGSPEEQIERIASAGYDGIEFAPGHDSIPADRRMALLQAHQLRLIAMAFVSRPEDLAPALEPLADFGPLKINVHSGRDSMSREEGQRFFEEALRVEQQIGLPVCHETHRGRLFFTPWDTAFYLRQFDTLKLCVDYSHWVNVCERLPADQQEALDLANQRAHHIHARVGYEEGPQVPDPAAPEYRRHLDWHEQQWSAIHNYRQAEGAEFLTLTPEYGPPHYLHTLPYTQAPVADLWSVCLWGAERARQVFG